MKTSQILASLFFGSLAAAVPINQRDLVTKTEMVIETVVVYTTVWDDEPVAEATTTAAAFYEEPASSVEAKPTTSAAAPTSAVVETPMSIYTPPVQTPSPKPAPVTSAAPKPETPKPEAPKPETQAPAPEPETTAAPEPEPEPTPVVAEPVPAQSSAVEAPPAAAPTAASSGSGSGSGSGDEHTGEITIYQPNGALGACGSNLSNDEMVVAIATTAWGVSTYNSQTGEATNPWCGKKVKMNYKGNSVTATIMDMCPGCSGFDLDLSPAVWKALTGSDEQTRYTGMTWSTVS